MPSCIFQTPFLLYLAPLNPGFLDCVGVVVIIIDGIGPCLFQNPFQFINYKFAPFLPRLRSLAINGVECRGENTLSIGIPRNNAKFQKFDRHQQLQEDAI